MLFEFTDTEDQSPWDWPELLGREADLEDRAAEIEEFYRDEVSLRRFKTPDGWPVYAAVLRHISPRGQLVILPGRGEIAHKYAEFLYAMQAARIETTVLFTRGQGESRRLLPDRQKCHLTEVDALRRDAEFMLRELDVRRYRLLGFSLGGLVALDLLAHGRLLPERVALAAPFLWPHYPWVPRPWLRLALRLICRLPGCDERYVPGGGPYCRVAFAENHHSHSEWRYRNYHDYYAEHPELTVGAATFGFARQAVQKQDELRRSAGDFRVPIKLVLAGNDLVVDNRAARHFVAAHARDCVPPQCAEVSGAFHDLLNERDDFRLPALTQCLEFLFPQAEPHE